MDKKRKRKKEKMVNKMSMYSVKLMCTQKWYLYFKIVSYHRSVPNLDNPTSSASNHVFYVDVYILGRR